MFSSRYWLALVGVVLMVSACRVMPPSAGPVPDPAATFPLAIKDDLGRELLLPRAATRIVSLAPSNTEILYAVGAGDLVVGVTKFCDYPPAAAGLPQVGGFSPKTISIEAIIGLRPDLVLAAGEIHQPVIAALEQVSVPVVALAPRDFKGICANIALAGKLTGRQEAAQALVAGLRARVEAVTKVIAGIPAAERVTVYWEVWHEPLMTAGPTSFVGQLIALAGGENIFAELTEQQFPTVSAEEVLRRNPMVILGPEHHGSQLTLEALRSRPGWEHLRAVKDGRVHLVDGNTVSRAGPRIVEGLEAVARALYPSRFR